MLIRDQSGELEIWRYEASPNETGLEYWRNYYKKIQLALVSLVSLALSSTSSKPSSIFSWSILLTSPFAFCFLLFAFCFYFAFVTNLMSRFGSHHTLSQASPHTLPPFALPLYNTHTHSLSLIFPSGFYKPLACLCFAWGGGLCPPPGGSYSWGRVFSSTISQCILIDLIIILMIKIKLNINLYYVFSYSVKTWLIWAAGLSMGSCDVRCQGVGSAGVKTGLQLVCCALVLWELDCLGISERCSGQ